MENQQPKGVIKQQLVDYINQQLQSGVSKEVVKNTLIANGWNENDITQALNAFNSSSMQANPNTLASKSNRKIIFYIAFASVLLIAGIIGGQFYLNKTSFFSGKVEVNNKTLSQWTQVSQIENQECREIVTKGDKIFISCDNHLYKSFDRGKTWEIDSYWDNLNSQTGQAKLNLNDFPYHMVFDKSGNTVFAASAISGIYRSRDGRNWEAVNNGVRTKFSEKDGVGVSALVISPSNNNVLYAVAGDYTLIKTENMGDSWEMMQEFVSINGLSVDTNDPNQIYLDFVPTIKSSDGGKTIITGQDTLPKTSSIKSYYIDPTNFQRIIIGGLGGIFVSNNGGNSWESLSDTLKGKDIPQDTINFNPLNQFDTIVSTGQKWIVSLSVNPIDSNIIVAGTETEGVIASKDGGKTWVEVNKGLVLEKENQKEFIITRKVRWSDDGSRLYLLSNHGVYLLE